MGVRTPRLRHETGRTIAKDRRRFRGGHGIAEPAWRPARGITPSCDYSCDQRQQERLQSEAVTCAVFQFEGRFRETGDTLRAPILNDRGRCLLLKNTATCGVSFYDLRHKGGWKQQCDQKAVLAKPLDAMDAIGRDNDQIAFDQILARRLCVEPRRTTIEPE